MHIYVTMAFAGRHHHELVVILMSFLFVMDAIQHSTSNLHDQIFQGTSPKVEGFAGLNATGSLL